MSTDMPAYKWINYMRSIINILREKGLSFSYNCMTNSICTMGGEDITPHLMAVYESIDKIEDEYWREKICKAHNIPIDLLFPTDKKKSKYKFILDKKQKVYISGPITGRKEEEYKSDFNNAELWLTGLGYDVVNPVSYGLIENGKWEDYMRRDIKLLCDCDYIYLLDGWQDSRGSRVEYGVACDLGIKILSFDINGKVV